ncbi:MAG: class I SAM-dependent methyltransferase [Promethearchaeota archaeon]
MSLKKNLHFHMMAFFFKFSRTLAKIQPVLTQANLKPGDHVVDYGAGTGSYSIPSAALVGPTGKIFAADIHPLAARYIQRGADKAHLSNITMITTDRALPLQDSSVDKVLLIDVMHHLHPLQDFLQEFYRVLTPKGNLILAIDHGDLTTKANQLVAAGYFTVQEIKTSVAIFQKKE